MAINPYTLNSLVNHGIIDSYDPELAVGFNPVIQPQNNYMNTAMQGQLYQNYGMQPDSFTSSNVYNRTAIGSKSNSFMNMFGNQSVGTNYQGDILGTGAQGIGSKYYGDGENAYGGFADARNNLNGGIAKAQSLYDRIPSFVKGIIAVGIGVLGIKMMFKGKVKNFFSKLNPVNWFKKKEVPVEPPKKESIWSKLKFWDKSK